MHTLIKKRGERETYKIKGDRGSSSVVLGSGVFFFKKKKFHGSRKKQSLQGVGESVCLVARELIPQNHEGRGGKHKNEVESSKGIF